MLLVNVSLRICRPEAPTYTFYPGETLAGRQIAEQYIFSETRCENPAVLAERNTAAGVDWLNDFVRLKGRLDLCFERHDVLQQLVQAPSESLLLSPPWFFHLHSLIVLEIMVYYSTGNFLGKNLSSGQVTEVNGSGSGELTSTIIAYNTLHS